MPVGEGIGCLSLGGKTSRLKISIYSVKKAKKIKKKVCKGQIMRRT
jgi:hypothetical protein